MYLDVRSEPEFKSGHPVGAFNIPLLHLDEATGRPDPNAGFERVATSTLDKHAKIIVGCQSGGRSQRAAEILTGLGFTNVVNMQGGFGGARDPSGQVSVAGWQRSSILARAQIWRARRSALLSERRSSSAPSSLCSCS